MIITPSCLILHIYKDEEHPNTSNLQSLNSFPFKSLFAAAASGNSRDGRGGTRQPRRGVITPFQWIARGGQVPHRGDKAKCTDDDVGHFGAESAAAPESDFTASVHFGTGWHLPHELVRTLTL